MTRIMESSDAFSRLLVVMPSFSSCSCTVFVSIIGRRIAKIQTEMVLLEMEKDSSAQSIGLFLDEKDRGADTQVEMNMDYRAVTVHKSQDWGCLYQNKFLSLYTQKVNLGWLIWNTRNTVGSRFDPEISYSSLILATQSLK